MKEHIRKHLHDDRGSQIVEWIGFTGAIVVLIIAVYAVIYGNAQMRGAVTYTTTKMAHQFGRDTGWSGPGMPEMPDFLVSIEAPAITQPEVDQPMIDQPIVDQPVIGQPVVGQPSVGQPGIGGTPDPSAAARIQIDPRTGAYVATDPQTGARWSVAPAEGVHAEVDSRNGSIRLTDPGRQAVVVLNPISNQAVRIDPATGVRQAIDLETAQQLGMITVEEQPAPPAPWIPAPVIALPALLAGGR